MTTARAKIVEVKTPLLAIRDLTVSFRRNGQWTPVVSNINLDIAPKETLAVVGESGSGKSVTAMSIMRLLPPKASKIEGNILFQGRDLTTLSDDAVREIRGNEIAMIFQESSLNPVYTVGFHLVETLRRHRGFTKERARSEAITLLEKVRIPSAQKRLDEYPHQFSGGMRQRVMIAIALACSPKLLIADEPTTALDVTIQSQILELIKELQDSEGMSVLFITHDMGVVAEIADRTAVMFRGNVIEGGQTASIFYQPQQPYTKALLSAVPKLGDMRGSHAPRRFVSVGGAAPPEQGIEDHRLDQIGKDRKPLLEVKDLTTRFATRGGSFGSITGAIHAVEKVSFDLFAGETLSLVGESGCGKSTTGRSILRLTNYMSGTVKIDGIDISALNPSALRLLRKRVQMIFQDPVASLNPRITVGSAIAEPFMVHKLGTQKQARDKTVYLLERVGLQADMANRYPHEFSGGQRQRISIARALILDPKLIVADEVVSALDVSVKAQVINLMLDLQKQLGLAFMFISHDMAVVERISHRVAVMYLGEIVEIGSRSAIFENPQHSYTRKLLAAVPVADPSRRHVRRGVSNDEIKSPFRSLNFIPPERSYRQVNTDHFVQLE